MSFVVCQAKITGPVWTPKMRAMGLRPNMPCGAKVPVRQEADAMDFLCPHGHRFIAGRADVMQPSEGEEGT